MKFAEIILPIPLKGTFTYRIPEDQKTPSMGSRVIVQFGSKTIYTGIIKSITHEAPSGYEPKSIIEILDDESKLTSRQMQFIEWIASYYMCTIGEAFNASFPSGLKLSSDSFISLLPEFDADEIALNEKENHLLNILAKGELRLHDVTKITGLKSPYRILKSLSDKNAIHVFEKIKDKYAPKKQRRIRITDTYLVEEKLDELSEKLNKKQKQLDVLVAFLKLVPILENPSSNQKGIAKNRLLEAGISTSSLKTLIKNKIFVEWDEIVDRFSETSDSIDPFFELSKEQHESFSNINDAFEQYRTVLLHGVTGSGKTEIYIKLIGDVIDYGGQVLYLLPEIALTTQIIKRFRKVFGNKFGVYHSRFSENERVDVYNKCLHGEFNFIIGVRSAIFLPFKDLKLIIIDEEHEHSYKQFEPAPRYHARDAAIYLAGLFDAQVLLGTATPSMESFQNVIDDKFGYVELSRRFMDQALPDIKLVDMAKARKQRSIKGSFSNELLEHIVNTFENKKQIILFQNRRGYAPFMQCDHCGNIPSCPNCSVSLTYHVFQSQLICHYCGHHEYLTDECIQCNSQDVRTVGIGTEKIEEELEILVPELTIQRMDLDSTRNKYSYQRIIDDFELGKTHVLVGTQMVTKGLDFEHVNLVGVFDVDRLIHFPDFRSHERVFQLITQVSGRAGRKHETGKVLIQTTNPEDPILQMILHSQQSEFYQKELEERNLYRYPPFFRLIHIIIRHKEKEISLEAAKQLYQWMIKDLGHDRLSIPIEPLVGKIRNYYYHELMIRIEKQGINLGALKEFLLSSRDTLLALPAFKSVRIHFDVDPL